MNLLDLRSTILDDDHRSTNPSLVRSDVNALLTVIDVNRDEFRDLSGSTEESELGDESRSGSSESENVSVEIDDEMSFGVNLCSVEYVDICATTGQKKYEELERRTDLRHRSRSRYSRWDLRKRRS